MDLYILLCIFSAVLCYAFPQDKATSSSVGSTVYATTTCICGEAPGTTGGSIKDSHVASSSARPSTTAPKFTSSTVATTPSEHQTSSTPAAGASSANMSSIASSTADNKTSALSAVSTSTSKATSHLVASGDNKAGGSSANAISTTATESVKTVTATATDPNDTPTPEIRSLIEEGLEESDMILAGGPHWPEGYSNPGSIYCGIHVKNANSSSTSIPRCLADLAILDFCSFTTNFVVTSQSPSSTKKKGGYWTTYIFKLYIGLEVSQTRNDCVKHDRQLQSDSDGHNSHCVDYLRGLIIDVCDSDTTRYKWGGGKTDDCEWWAIYPIPFSSEASDGWHTTLKVEDNTCESEDLGEPEVWFPEGTSSNSTSTSTA